ncbi:MAG: hypothetical protein ABEJ55_05300 [Halanaeroarchaeum sp.]
MLTVTISDFSIQVDDGAIKNVGGVPKRAEIGQYDVRETTVREYGDERVKVVFTDGDDNTVEVALSPDDVLDLAADVESLAESSSIFE